MKAWQCKRPALLFTALLLTALAGVPAALAQYLPGANCPAHQWANGYGFTTGLACAQPNYTDLAGTPPSADYSLASGFVNRLRGNSLSQWYSGTSIAISTSGGWASEGVYVVPTGAAVTASQQASPAAGGPYYALKIAGAAGVSDVKLRFPIESFDAAPLAGQAVTFQITWQNKSGGSITPTLTTKYPGAQDDWTGSSTDLAATGMPACADNATCTSAYTLAASASAADGYTPTVDFGALGSGAYIQIIRFDMRATPGVATGPTGSPPAAEIRDPASDAVWCQRFFETSYNNGMAPGSARTGGGNGLIFGTTTSNVFGLRATVRFAVKKRTTPAVTVYDGAGNSGKSSTTTNGSWSNNGGIVIENKTDSAFQTYSGNGLTNLSDFMYGFDFAADARIAGG